MTQSPFSFATFTEPQTLLVAVNGILTPLSDVAWNERAAAKWKRDGHGLGVVFSYYADVLGGSMNQRILAEALAATVVQSKRDLFPRRIFLCHSLGCLIATKAIAEYGAECDELILLAPAMACDCNESGLNAAAERVKRVTLYRSQSDAALALGSIVPGYGPLGKDGPINLTPRLWSILTEVVDNTKGHNDWTADTYIDGILTNLAAGNVTVTGTGNALTDPAAGVKVWE